MAWRWALQDIPAGLLLLFFFNWLLTYIGGIGFTPLELSERASYKSVIFADNQLQEFNHFVAEAIPLTSGSRGELEFLCSPHADQPLVESS
jgi:hypothetical protein